MAGPQGKDAEANFGLSRASSLIDQHIHEILAIWRDQSRRLVSRKPDISDAALNDSLPDLLRRLASALLPSSAGDEVPGSAAEEHGRQRHKLRQFSLEQVIEEYALLRQVLFNFLDAAGPWSVEDRNRINMFLDTAICRSASEFKRIDDAEAHEDVAESRRAQDKVARERDQSQHEVSKLQQQQDDRKQFVALLTHDLRTPLTSIGLQAQRLTLRTYGRESMLEIAKRIENGVARIDSMVRDMLDFNSLEAGVPLTVKPEPANLAQVAFDVCSALGSMHSRKLRLRLGKDLKGRWDQAALERCLENLVCNAIKYGAPDHPIVVTAKRHQRGIRLSVQNAGEPISEEKLAVIFQPYVRSKEADKAQGWGLGLSLVAAVAAAHHGTVGASSDLRQGTCFWIDLPLDEH